MRFYLLGAYGLGMSALQGRTERKRANCVRKKGSEWPKFEMKMLYSLEWWVMYLCTYTTALRLAVPVNSSNLFLLSSASLPIQLQWCFMGKVSSSRGEMFFRATRKFIGYGFLMISPRYPLPFFFSLFYWAFYVEQCQTNCLYGICRKLLRSVECAIFHSNWHDLRFATGTRDFNDINCLRRPLFCLPSQGPLS